MKVWPFGVALRGVMVLVETEVAHSYRTANPLIHSFAKRASYDIDGVALIVGPPSERRDHALVGQRTDRSIGDQLSI
jgi:hypothetical protein